MGTSEVTLESHGGPAHFHDSSDIVDHSVGRIYYVRQAIETKEDVVSASTTSVTEDTEGSPGKLSKRVSLQEYKRRKKVPVEGEEGEGPVSPPPLVIYDIESDLTSVVDDATEDVPVGEVSRDDVSVGGEDVPVGEVSKEDVPIDEVSKEDVPIDEVSKEDVPVGGVTSPKEDVPVDVDVLVGGVSSPNKDVPVGGVTSPKEDVPVDVDVPVGRVTSPKEDVPVGGVSSPMEDVPMGVDVPVGRVSSPMEDVPVGVNVPVGVVSSPKEDVPVGVVSSPKEDVPVGRVSSPKEDVLAGGVSSPMENVLVGVNVPVGVVSSPKEDVPVGGVSSPKEDVLVGGVSSPMEDVPVGVNVPVGVVSSPKEDVPMGGVSSPMEDVPVDVNVPVDVVSSPKEDVPVGGVSSPKEDVLVGGVSNPMEDVPVGVNVPVGVVSSPKEDVLVGGVSSPMEDVPVGVDIPVGVVSSPKEDVPVGVVKIKPSIFAEDEAPPTKAFPSLSISLEVVPQLKVLAYRACHGVMRGRGQKEKGEGPIKTGRTDKPIKEIREQKGAELSKRQEVVPQQMRGSIPHSIVPRHWSPRATPPSQLMPTYAPHPTPPVPLFQALHPLSMSHHVPGPPHHTPFQYHMPHPLVTPYPNHASYPLLTAGPWTPPISSSTTTRPPLKPDEFHQLVTMLHKERELLGIHSCGSGESDTPTDHTSPSSPRSKSCSPRSLSHGSRSHSPYDPLLIDVGIQVGVAKTGRGTQCKPKMFNDSSQTTPTSKATPFPSRNQFTQTPSVLIKPLTRSCDIAIQTTPTPSKPRLPVTTSTLKPPTPQPPLMATPISPKPHPPPIVPSEPASIAIDIQDYKEMLLEWMKCKIDLYRLDGGKGEGGEEVILSPLSGCSNISEGNWSDHAPSMPTPDKLLLHDAKDTQKKVS